MDTAASGADDARSMNPRDIVTSDDTGRTPTRYIEHLTDDDLAVLNQLLPWRCFTLDSRGRRFGVQASDTKRNVPQVIPDQRIVELDRRFPLASRSVLEIGCFEGVHTIALGQRAASVIAIDSRIENVIKTMVRTWSFGLHATCFKCDVEQDADFALVPEVDVVHHVGVLYHLVDPIAHLQRLLPRTRHMLLLDTHVASEGQHTGTYKVAGREYPYWHYREGGRADAFSGMYDHAKWLPIDTLTGALRDLGFADVDVASLRQERNGMRATIFARRAAR